MAHSKAMQLKKSFMFAAKILKCCQLRGCLCYSLNVPDHHAHFTGQCPNWAAMILKWGDFCSLDLVWLLLHIWKQFLNNEPFWLLKAHEFQRQLKSCSYSSSYVRTYIIMLVVAFTMAVDWHSYTNPPTPTHSWVKCAQTQKSHCDEESPSLDNKHNWKLN